MDNHDVLVLLDELDFLDEWEERTNRRRCDCLDELLSGTPILMDDELPEIWPDELPCMEEFREMWPDELPYEEGVKEKKPPRRVRSPPKKRRKKTEKPKLEEPLFEEMEQRLFCIPETSDIEDTETTLEEQLLDAIVQQLASIPKMNDLEEENRNMAFFTQAITQLQTVVVAIGGGLGVWGLINLLEGYGNDNPGAKSQGMKQLMAGGGVAIIGTTLIPVLATLF